MFSRERAICDCIVGSGDLVSSYMLFWVPAALLGVPVRFRGFSSPNHDPPVPSICIDGIMSSGATLVLALTRDVLFADGFDGPRGLRFGVDSTLTTCRGERSRAMNFAPSSIGPVEKLALEAELVAS